MFFEMLWYVFRIVLELFVSLFVYKEKEEEEEDDDEEEGV